MNLAPAPQATAAMLPAQALLWQVWRRHRYGLFADGAYLAIAALIIRLVPENILRLEFGNDRLPLMAWFLGIPCGFVVLHLLMMFSVVSEGAKDTGYPPRMFVLPVPTHFLVVWPMIHGCLALVCLWLVIATQILWPAGIAAPLWRPSVLLVICLLGLQAISWVPLAQNWLRTCIAVPLFMALFGGAAAAVSWNVSGGIITGVMVCLVPLIFAISWHGVAMGRRGDTYSWQLWERLMNWAAARRRAAGRPFASAAAAQLWFECRGQAWFLPVSAGSMLLFLAPWPAFFERDDLAFGWRLAAIMLGLPAFLAGALGAPLGRQDAWSKYALGPFMSTRPMTSAALVKAKMQMCRAVSALATWGITMLVMTPILLRPGFVRSIYDTGQAIGWVRAVAVVLAAALGSLVLTWMQMAASLWLGLTGREWVVNVVTFSFVGLLGVPCSLGFWVYLHPEWQPFTTALLLWIVDGFLVVKLVVATCVTTALLRSQLMTWPTLIRCVGTWSLVVGALLGLTAWLVPATLFSMGQTLPALALSVPFSRLAGATLALEWNRHR